MTGEEQELQNEIIQTTETSLLPEPSFNLFREKLASYIHELINHDFEKLLRILYRLDVSEPKLKTLLAKEKEDAGLLIADAIIERQMQKIKTRKKFHTPQQDIPEEDKW